MSLLSRWGRVPAVGVSRRKAGPLIRHRKQVSADLPFDGFMGIATVLAMSIWGAYFYTLSITTTFLPNSGPRKEETELTKLIKVITASIEAFDPGVLGSMNCNL
jgi:hypothetical protein